VTGHRRKTFHCNRSARRRRPQHKSSPRGAPRERGHVGGGRV
jgi:hypothetical protein